MPAPDRVVEVWGERADGTGFWGSGWVLGAIAVLTAAGRDGAQ